MLYFVRTPGWLQKLFAKRIWKIKGSENEVFLSFDDGPHPLHTPFVLDELKKYNAKATFFCIGNNVERYPDVYKRIIEEGHAVGNHTQHHVNGSRTTDADYIDDVAAAVKNIESVLFRPPYGRLSRFKEKLLLAGTTPYTIIMWTVLSADFDPAVTPQRCLENVLLKTKAGNIVVFHDSEKAAEKMRYALPKVLHAFTQKNMCMKAITI